MKNTISILGTGWLGFKLAKKCRDSFNVKVSLRDNSKKQKMIDEGLSPFILNEEDFQSLDELLNTDYLFINYPPSKFQNYLKFLETIFSNEKILKIKKVFFISSTSIYPNKDAVFTEDYEIKNSVSKIVYEAEQLIKERVDVVFRCSGLMGYNRVAGQYFAGKTLDSEDVKVNYVHRDDVISATLFAIENDLNGVFNLCSSSHLSRKEIYLYNASKYGFEEPIFKDKKEYKNRIIDGSKIETKGFRYKYPNPLDYI